MAERVSVVIPTFNNEDVLRRCLTIWQLSAATCGVEIIVIEDGCRDGDKRGAGTDPADPSIHP